MDDSKKDQFIRVKKMTKNKLNKLKQETELNSHDAVINKLMGDKE